MQFFPLNAFEYFMSVICNRFVVDSTVSKILGTKNAKNFYFKSDFDSSLFFRFLMKFPV